MHKLRVEIRLALGCVRPSEIGVAAAILVNLDGVGEVVLLIDDDLVVEVSGAGGRGGCLLTHELLPGGFVLGIRVALHNIARRPCRQILGGDQRLLLLLIEAVYDVIAVSPAIHESAVVVIDDHFAGGACVGIHA